MFDEWAHGQNVVTNTVPAHARVEEREGKKEIRHKKWRLSIAKG